MTTSATIKGNQYNPPTILERTRDKSGNLYSWMVEGRSRSHYWVWRGDDNGNLPDRFKCGCPAGRLCRHVQAAVRDLAEGAGYDLVQFWTTPEKARRQRRRLLEFTAHGVPFWVTFARRPQVQERRLQTQLEAVNEKLKETRRQWYMIGHGPEKYVLRDEVRRLNEESVRLMKEWVKAKAEIRIPGGSR